MMHNYALKVVQLSLKQGDTERRLLRDLCSTSCGAHFQRTGTFRTTRVPGDWTCALRERPTPHHALAPYQEALPAGAFPGHAAGLEAAMAIFSISHSEPDHTGNDETLNLFFFDHQRNPIAVRVMKESFIPVRRPARCRSRMPLQSHQRGKIGGYGGTNQQFHVFI